MLGDLGGQRGLWIGVSVLTLCELLELFVDLAILVFIKLKSKGEFSPSKSKSNKIAASDTDNIKARSKAIFVESADDK